MITATPPAYYESIDVNELHSKPRGASDDSAQIDACSMLALKHLISTPRHMLEPVGDADDYNVLQPGSVRTKRVRFRYVGPGKPMQLGEDIDLR